ncbi:Hsp20/alpha crystallin family protein [Sorangium sp. So ce388]|uniref:Hsp20/alpha crystallin family protein n=1 Tax=Sorangium sp. So ce388 TaxID=3133309 RepID=UPI003F5BE039
MANLNIRRGEPLATAWEPAHMTDPLRALDPFRIIRDLMGADPFAGMVQAASTVFEPNVEIKETKDSYVLNIDLPGVREQDLEVSVTGNRLTVSGRREEEERREDERFFAYERSYGAFSRSFVMPEGADLGRLRAEFGDGVLRITVPKKAEMQSRRVQIGGGKEAGGKELPSGQSAERGGTTAEAERAGTAAEKGEKKAA